MGRSEDKHNDIISAAISEFGEKGMMATTMESIATRACVSKRTLYKHYPCKINLLDVVVNQLLERIESLQEVTYDPQSPLVDQLKKLAYRIIQLTSDKDYLHLSRIVIIESMHSQEQAEHLNKKFTSCEIGLHSWFYQAADAGALGAIEPKMAANMFYGSLKKQAFWEQVISWKPNLTDEEAEQLVNQTCEFFALAFTNQS